MIDVLFRQLYVWVVVELESRRVIHFGVTRHPSQFWTAQRLREATANGRRPRYIIRDNDNKYGRAFDIAAAAAGIEVKRTPVKAPLANAICERFVGSVRRECLDHMLIFCERQLHRVVEAYVAYFDRSRRIKASANVPCGPPMAPTGPTAGKIISLPVLNGLHHEYRRAA